MEDTSMSSQPNFGHPRLAWACLLLAAAPASAGVGDRAATLIVRLPADARLVVDGNATKQTGPMRRFYTPPLESGERYHYTLEWTYRRDGNPVTKRKVVYFRAGQQQ